ncbi:MAG: NAD(P)-dependent oxidoreductase, partial [Myxococcales bacterium]|nr:NAD(P)-dependent oxidoreductase [Myxococcales bacterium]
VGGGVLDALAPGAVLVDHTTASAALARELDARARAGGRAFLDAPVSGGQAGAERGALTVMVGGDEAVLARVRPVLDAYAQTVRRIGPAGCGQLAKMVNQIAIAGVIEGLSEALHFALAAGLDVEAVVGAVSRGAAQSWQMENRWQTMVRGEFEHGFAVEWMRKDLRIAFAEAERNGADLPVARQVDAYYADVEAMGGARWDTSSLIARLERARSARGENG